MSKVIYEIFVSSALNELENEREIAREVIDELNMQPGMFELLPAMSKSLEDSYLDKVESCELFLLILDQSVRPAVREEYLAARNKGKPVIVFLKRSLRARADEPTINELMTELHGGKVDEDPFIKYFYSLKELREHLKQAILNELSLQATQVPRTARTKKDLYKLATQIISSAKRRVYIFQRTPSLLLGPRPYHDKYKVSYEEEFLSTLEDWIERAKDDHKKDLMYLFSPQATEKEIGNNEVLKKRVKNNMSRLKDIEEKSGYRIRFSCPRFDFSGPIAIGDDRFSLWITGDDDAVFLSFQNKRLTDELVNVFEQFGSKILSTQDTLNLCSLKV